MPSPAFKPFPQTFSARFKVLLEDKAGVLRPSSRSSPNSAALVSYSVSARRMLPPPTFLCNDAKVKRSEQVVLHPDVLVKCHVGIALPRCDDEDRGRSTAATLDRLPADTSVPLLRLFCIFSSSRHVLPSLKLAASRKVKEDYVIAL